MQMQAADPNREPSIDAAIELIDVSPTNPRRFYDELAMEALTASVHMRGVIQPVLLRPSPHDPERYELVFGTRRLMASKRDERTTIPAIVKELSDLEVAELQVIENSQREDVHPIEEGEAFQAMRVAGASVAQIATKIQQSTSHVYGRLRLAALAHEVKEAAFRGVLDTSILLVLARLPQELQVKAATEIAQHGADSDEPWSFREALDWLDEEFLVRIDQAPWDPEDTALNPPAPACSSCPSRGGNIEGMPKRFANVCTDIACAEGKQQAFVDRRLITARAHGIKVLSKEEAERVIPDEAWRSLQGGWIKADDMCLDFAEPRSWSKALAEAKLLPDAIALHPRTGDPIELLQLKNLDALKKQLAKAGVAMRKTPTPSKHPSPARPAASQAPKETPLNHKIAHAVLRRLAVAVMNSPALDVCALRGLVGEYQYAFGPIPPLDGTDGLHPAFLKPADMHKLDERQLLGLLILGAAQGAIEDHVIAGEELNDHMVELFKSYKVSPAAIKAELEAAAKAPPAKDKGTAKGKGKASPAAKASPAPTTKDKGTAKGKGKAPAAKVPPAKGKGKGKTTPKKKR